MVKGFRFGRALMYATLGALLAFVLASYLLIENGGATMRTVQELSLHDLTSSPQSYDGQTVITSGTLVHNDELGVYEVVDPDANFPLEIRKFGEGLLSAMTGKSVRVSGKFGNNGGIHIDADDVRLVSAGTPGPDGG